MKRVIEKKPAYLVEQPYARLVISNENLKIRDFQTGEIFSRLSHQLAEVISEKMEVVKYAESRVTGEVYDDPYNYAPHDDPLCDVIYEAYLPQFNEMQERIIFLENELRKRTAYEEYYR